MLEGILSYITEISNGNDMIAGALALALSGIAASAAAFILKDTPRTLCRSIWAQVTTSMVLNNTDYQKNQTFIAMSAYIRENSNHHLTRNLMLDSIYCHKHNDTVLHLTVGYGLHLFMYGKRLMWVRKTKEESSGSEKQKEQLVIYTLGRSHKAFERLAEDLTPKRDDSQLGIYEYTGEEWIKANATPKLDIDRLALNKSTLDELRGAIDFFKDNREAMLSKGLPHKLALLLHGRAGNGKSTVIRALASKYGLNIALVPLARFSDEALKKAFATAPKGAIIVMEDFDSATATHARKNVTGDVKAVTTKESGDSDVKWLTLSGVLNVLDGVVPLDDRIVIMTTNCKDSLDSAVLREGRTDVTIELPPIEPEAVKNHFELLYGALPNKEYPSLIAKDINSIKIRSKLDPVLVSKEIEKHLGE